MVVRIDQFSSLSVKRSTDKPVIGYALRSLDFDSPRLRNVDPW